MTRIFLVALGLICLPYLASAIVDEWTPEGFDWDSAFINDSIPNGLSMRLDEVPETTDLAYPLIQTDELGVQLVPIAAFFGIAYRVSTVAVAGISLKNTVETCQQTANKEATVYKCLEGVFGTAMAFGGAASASKRLGNQLRGVLFPHRFQTGGTAEIELENFPIHRHPPRDAQAQLGHNEFVREQLRSLSSNEPEFMGYADDDHKLAQRDFGTHPLVPMFRFNHSTHGSMEITTRDTHNGTFFTVAHAGQSTHLMGRRQLDKFHAKMKRQEVYDHELLKEGAVEARFDPKASQANPAKMSANAGDLFNVIMPDIDCFMGQDLKDGSILDVQMYDKTNRATFGFGSIGVYKNTEDSNSIEQMAPEGMPLPQCN